MNTEIREASERDIPALCEIWQQCFADSEDYIRLFYEKNFESIKVLAVFADGTPVSMLHMIDAAFEYGDKRQPAKFIYATGTLKEHRKRGYMSALIKTVADMADKSGCALFLKPSSPAAAEFYKALGFREECALDAVNLIANEKQPITVYDLSPDGYNRMREAALADAPHVKWDDAHIKWCVEENEYFSGRTLGIKYDNNDFFFMGYPEENVLIINETDMSQSQLGKISGSLCGIFGTDYIKAYMPCGKGENAVSALYYNAQIDNPYANMIMI